MRDQSIIESVLGTVRKPDFIKRSFVHEIGKDHVGEPAVWIRVIVTDQEAAKRTFFEDTQAYADEIRESLRQNDVERWPYFTFRSESEEAEPVEEEEQ